MFSVLNETHKPHVVLLLLIVNVLTVFYHFLFRYDVLNDTKCSPPASSLLCIHVIVSIFCALL